MRITESQLRKIVAQEIAKASKLQLEGRSFNPRMAKDLGRYIVDLEGRDEALELYNKAMGENNDYWPLLDVAAKVAHAYGMDPLPPITMNKDYYLIGEILRGLAYELEVPFKRSVLKPFMRPAWRKN